MLDATTLTILFVFLVLSVLALIKVALKRRYPMDIYVSYLWVFFLVFVIAEIHSFDLAVWVLAGLCFAALREFFSLINIRLQDRWSMLVGYLSIPFMIYFIQIEWYGMFIISIPVYAFLATAFLATVGGNEREGIVFSIGAINFGLFLFVYCIGHLGYLLSYSTWAAIMLVLNVTVCDMSAYLFGERGKFTWRKMLAAVPVTVLLSWLIAEWIRFPWQHAAALAMLTPLFVAISRRTILFIETDLRIDSENLTAGKGKIIDNVKSYLFVAPIMLHYVRYYFA